MEKWEKELYGWVPCTHVYFMHFNGNVYKRNLFSTKMFSKARLFLFFLCFTRSMAL